MDNDGPMENSKRVREKKSINLGTGKLEQLE